MKIISTKEALREALKNKESKIYLSKEFGDKLIEEKKKKKKILTTASIATIAASTAAIPLTGGASLSGVIGGAAALTVGTTTISVVELAIICGTSIALAITVAIAYKTIQIDKEGNKTVYVLSRK